MDALNQLAKEINHCRRSQGCGYPPCGNHAVGKPTHQTNAVRGILVIGESPASGGWWVTGRAFYQRVAAGRTKLSRTGANLNHCLTLLGTRIEDVSFVEAVKCRPPVDSPWSPGNQVRQRCREFLRKYLFLTQPELILPFGRVATASCLEIAFETKQVKLEHIVGKPLEWDAPWSSCWILPLHHPSPANNGRWPANKQYLQMFVENHPDILMHIISHANKVPDPASYHCPTAFREK